MDVKIEMIIIEGTLTGQVVGKGFHPMVGLIELVTIAVSLHPHHSS